MTENIVPMERMMEFVSEVADDQSYRTVAKEWAETLNSAVGPNGSSTKAILDLVSEF